jgi:hypothetical protein
MSEPALLSLRSADAGRARAKSTAARRSGDAVRAPDLEILDLGGLLTKVRDTSAPGCPNPMRPPGWSRLARPRASWSAIRPRERGSRSRRARHGSCHS